MTLCMPTIWLVPALLGVVLLVLPPALTAFTARYERRQAAPPRLAAPEAPWHAHCWQVAAGTRGEGVGTCACGAQAAVYVGN